jgi:putative transposase
VVLWQLRYKLSLRDLPEMLLIRGIVFSHEAVRDWEVKLTPALAEGLRRRRRGKGAKSGYVDETYIKVDGHWRCLILPAGAAAWPMGCRTVCAGRCGS